MKMLRSGGHRRLPLVLDLDETLVSRVTLPYIPSVFQDKDKYNAMQFRDQTNSQFSYVMLRLWADTLKYLSTYYKIYIYTASCAEVIPMVSYLLEDTLKTAGVQVR